MRATVYNGPYSLEVVERPDPVITAPTDAVVRVSLGCVCGSDLWYYRGESPHALGPIGHEFIGVVEDMGAEVRGLGPGDLVVAPFTFSDGTCPYCRAGVTSKCIAGGSFGNHGIDGGQGEAVRVPLAASTLVRVPDVRHSDATMRSLAAPRPPASSHQRRRFRHAYRLPTLRSSSVVQCCVMTIGSTGRSSRLTCRAMRNR